MLKDRQDKKINMGEVKEWLVSQERQSPQSTACLSFRKGADLQDGTSVKSARATMFDCKENNPIDATQRYFQELYPGTQRFVYVAMNFVSYTLTVDKMKEFVSNFAGMDKNTKDRNGLKPYRLRLRSENKMMIEWLKNHSN